MEAGKVRCSLKDIPTNAFFSAFVTNPASSKVMKASGLPQILVISRLHHSPLPDVQEDADRGRPRRGPAVPRGQAARSDHPSVQVPGPQHQRAHPFVHRGRLHPPEQRDQDVGASDDVHSGSLQSFSLMCWRLKWLSIG